MFIRTRGMRSPGIERVLPSGPSGGRAAEPRAFRVKVVEVFGRTVPIVLQDTNGPCPLLAIGTPPRLPASTPLARAPPTPPRAASSPPPPPLPAPPRPRQPTRSC